MFLCLLSLALSACTICWRYAGIKGVVLDMETKKPIQGAVVLVVYGAELESQGGGVAKNADAQEILTDKKGYFTIPANFVFFVRPPGSHFIKTPRIIVFKASYGAYPSPNSTKFENSFSPEYKNLDYIIGLRRIDSLEERLNNSQGINLPNDLHPEKYKLLQNARKSEIDAIYAN